MLRPRTTGDTGGGPVTLVCSMKFTGVIGASFDADKHVSNMAVILAFHTHNRNTDIFPDINKVIINSNTTCKKMVSYMWI